MKRIFSVWVVFSLISLMISCSKDEPKTAPGDKNDMFRDWNQKPQKRTPAPEPGHIFDRK